MVTPSPMVSPVGSADAMVMVAVVPLEVAVEILLVAPPHLKAPPGVQVGGPVPAAQAGIVALAVNASVAGLYNSDVFSADCPGGAPDPAAGVEVARNELPVEPPTISTWPSSAVPLPWIRVELGPLRAIVIKPPLPVPASVKVLVLSLYNSAVCSALHWKPLIPP